MTLLDFTSRLVLAISMGFLIGLERQLTGHMAGIRINTLVCLGTSLFVLFSIIMGAPDVTRIAAQIVTGVGFLCSGIIFKDGVNVRGLNTAATIWCSAAVGVLASSGQIYFAVVATLTILVSNITFKALAVKIKPLDKYDDSEKYYKINVRCLEKKEICIRAILINHIKNTVFTLIDLESEDTLPEKVEIQATLLCAGKGSADIIESLVKKVSLEEGVSKAGWEFVQ